MAWSTVTLSTLNSIAKYEAEINSMAGTYTRHTLALSDGGFLEIRPIGKMSTASLTVTYIDDTTETLAYDDINTRWSIVSGGKAVLIVQGDDVVFPCVSGSGDVYNADGNVYIDISECSGVAWDDSIVQTSWQNKCTVAKHLIGDEIKKQLSMKGYRDADVTSGEVLDYVWNYDALNTAADYLTLHLIYIDLYATQPTEAYKEKADYYGSVYEKALQNGLYQITYGESETYATPLFYTYGSRLQV